MGECGCASMVENHIFKLGDKFILVEEHPFCDFCDNDTAIGISELTKKDLEIYTDMEVKVKKLAVWMDREDKTEDFFINPLKICGTNKQIEQDIEKVFEKIWEKLDKKEKEVEELQDIKDSKWDVIREVFIKEFNKIMEVSADSSQP